MVVRLLNSLGQFTAYSIHPIELKLGKMILGISPHNLAEPDFIFPLRRCCGEGRLLQSSNRFTAYSSDAIEMKGCKMIQVIGQHKNSGLPSARLHDERFLNFHSRNSGN